MHQLVFVDSGDSVQPNIDSIDISLDEPDIIESIPSSSGKSSVWECFDASTEVVKDPSTGFSQYNKEAKCKFCTATFSVKKGNTSKLWSHLEKKHFAQYSKHAPTKLQTNRVNRMRKPSMQPDIKSALLKGAAYSSQSVEFKKRTAAVLNYIVSDGRPLSTVESKAFLDMLAAFDNRYKLPSRRTVSDEHIPQMYMKIKSDIQSAISENKHDAPRFSFTTDLWSSATMEPYISLTIHFVNSEMSLKKYTLETKYIPDKHTGVNLALAIEELLGYWNLDLSDVQVITTDSAANMIKMADEAKIRRLPCFGHILHNAVGKGMKGAEIERVIAKLKRIVAYFHQSHSRQRKLDEELKKGNKPPVKLLAECPTRWGTCYDMFKSIKSNLPEIKRVVVDEASHLVTNPDEDHMIDVVVEAFEELSLMTDGLSGEKAVTASAVIPMVSVIHALLYKPVKKNESRALQQTVYEYICDKYDAC